MIIAIGLISLIVWKVDLQEVFQRVGSVVVPWAVLCAFVILLVYYMRGLVICWLGKGKAAIGANRMFRLNLLGAFFSNFLPSQIGGDLVKGLYLGKHFSSMSEAYAAMFLQRALGVLGTFTVAIIASSVILPAHQIGLVTLAVLTGLTFVYVSWRILRSRPRSGFFSEENLLLKPFAAFFNACVSYGESKYVLFGCYLFSIFITLAGVAATYLAALAVGSEMTFFQVLVASSIAQLSILIQVSPGGLGILEGSFVGAGEYSLPDGRKRFLVMCVKEGPCSPRFPRSGQRLRQETRLLS